MRTNEIIARKFPLLCSAITSRIIPKDTRLRTNDGQKIKHDALINHDRGQLSSELFCLFPMLGLMVRFVFEFWLTHWRVCLNIDALQLMYDASMLMWRALIQYKVMNFILWSQCSGTHNLQCNNTKSHRIKITNYGIRYIFFYRKFNVMWHLEVVKDERK